MNQTPAFRCSITIRFRDIDAMGHVNNAVIFTYFEEGRKALFLDAFKESAPGGFNFILAHIECDYVLPILLDDRLVLEMWVTAIGTKSFKLAYALVDETDTDRIFARGSSVQVCYDYYHKRSMLVPQALKQALTAYHRPA